jgi:hypothetical protein
MGNSPADLFYGLLGFNRCGQTVTIGEADVPDRRSLRDLRSPRLFRIQPTMYLYGTRSCSIEASKKKVFSLCSLLYLAVRNNNGWSWPNDEKLDNPAKFKNY